MPCHQSDEKRQMITVPIILDFSSSGFAPESYPIEVGFSGRHGEGWCSLIRPESTWLDWDIQSAKKHQIPREILTQRGNSVKYIAEQLNFFLHGQTIHSDHWDVDFVWLDRIFSAANLTPQFILCDLYDIIKEEQLLLWDATKANIMKECCVERRRASGEAKVIQLTWLRTFDAINSVANLKSNQGAKLVK